MIRNFEAAKSLLKPHLREYLEEKGLSTSGNICCINPNHDDKNPSMGLVPGSDYTILHCFSCMPGEQEVVTENRGLVKIKDIIPYVDKTISLFGSTNTITNKMKSFGKWKPTYKIELHSIKNDNLIFTYDHKHFVIHYSKFPFLRKENGKLVYYNKFRKKPPKRFDKIPKKLEELTTDSLNSDYYVFIPERLIHVQNGHKIFNTWSREYRGSGQKAKEIEFIRLTPGMMWLFGLYLAEGNTYRGGINFSLGRHEQHLADRIKYIIENELGFNVVFDYNSKKPGSMNVRCSSTDLQLCFDSLFGKYAYGKRVPEYFLEADRVLQSELLRGIFDGDGNSRGTILTMCSKDLMRQVRQICINLKIPFTFSVKDEHIGNDGIKRKEAYSIYFKKCNTPRMFYDTLCTGQSGAFFKIENVSIADSYDEVWDITTEDSSFLTNYYSVHNCGANYDIIDTYAILEESPTEGAGWLVSTFLPLCSKYEVPVELEELTEEDKYRYSVYRAYDRAASVVKNAKPTDLMLDEIEKRKWNIIKVRDRFGVGSISFEDFIKSMHSYGYTRKFLEEIDLYNYNIFNEKGLIIPIKDDRGSVCGFVTRNLTCNKSKDVKKFFNTSKMCPIYNKSEILFNFDAARHKTPPLYITESYMDTITLVLNGIENVVGIGATALTDEHLDLLKRYEMNDIVLALDFDEAGQKATAKYVEQLSGNTGLNLKVLMPPDNIDMEDISDPEDLILKHGIDAFKNLPIVGAFEWKLLNDDYRSHPFDLAKNTVPIIANDPSPIERAKMCTILAKHTGIDITIIKDELDSILNLNSMSKASLKNDVVRKLIKDLQKNPTDAYSHVARALTQIEDLDSNNSLHMLGKDEYVEFLDYEKTIEETSEPSKYKSGFNKFDLKTCSRWSAPGTLIAVGGRSNSGKTALLINMAYNMATLNDDVICLFHTIDDSRALIIPKFISLVSGIKINHVLAPHSYKQYYTNMDMLHERNRAYNRMVDLAMNDRLIIKDSEYGTTLEAIEMWIKKYRKEYPDRKIIYFLDNFHLLSDLASTDERVRMKLLSKMIKNRIAVHHGVTVIMTVEYTKLEKGARPHNVNILETGQIEYDCNAIYHVYNPYSDTGTECDMDEWTLMEYDNVLQENVIRHKIELITGKNKLSAFKGSYYLKFAPEESRIDEIDRIGDNI